jgi:FixJ family two-component response regulator
MSLHNGATSILSLTTGFSPPPVIAPATIPCVHVIDDDPKYLEVLVNQLRSDGHEVEPYISAEHFLATYRPRAIECILIDMRMPGMNGLELLEILGKRHGCPPLVIVSAFAETPEIVQAIQHGAVDYLVKPVEDSALYSKVRTALGRDADNKRKTGDLTARLSRLTSREREVMELLLEAKNTLQIAHALEISPKTVEKHRTHIFDKLNVDSVPSLMQLVRRLETRQG